MMGSKRESKLSWQHGRGRNSFRGEMKFSLKKNKKYLNRRARHCKEPMQYCSYKKLVKEMAWDYLT